MKTDKELGEIGANAAFKAGVDAKNRAPWLLCVSRVTTCGDSREKTWNEDGPCRTAFAAAVREEIFAGVEGMPDLDHVTSICDTMEEARELMIAAFAKQTSESQKALGMAIDLNLDLQNKADMWRDEFERIKALVLSRHEVFNSEIAGVCDRAMQDIRSKISLIDQREKVAEENADLQSKLAAEQSLVRTLEGERDDLHDKLAAAEKRLAEIAKLPERWKSYVSAEACITELRQALKAEPTAEEIERAEFDKLWSSQPSWVHENTDKASAFFGWLAARAAKEVKATPAPPQFPV